MTSRLDVTRSRRGQGWTVRAQDAAQDDAVEPVERVLMRLPGKCKRIRDGRWMAQCPAHDDRTPSLSITQGRDGKALIHCFAGCHYRDVAAALGLQPHQLFPHDPDWKPTRRPLVTAEEIRHAESVYAIAAEALGRNENLSDEDWDALERAAVVLGKAGRAPPKLNGEAPHQAADGADGTDAKPGQESADQEQPLPIFPWYGADEWVKNLRAPDWVVPDYLERGSLNVTIGGWGSGKSAIELDKAARASLGGEWQGSQVSTALWVYVVGEAQRGFQRRIAAWCKHHQVEPCSRLVLIPEGVLLGERDHEEALRNTLDAVQQHHGECVSAVTLDTMARCFGLDDENSNSDVSRWVDAIHRAIVEPTGAGVSVLHHPGHAAKERGRGASALPGAADTEWLVQREGSLVVMRCNKNKDGEIGEPVAWTIQSVAVDAGGVEVQAPVAVECEAPSQEPDVRPGSKQAAALTVLVEMYAEAKGRMRDQGRPEHDARIDRDAWRQQLIDSGVVAGKYPRQAANGLIGELKTKGAVTMDGPWMYPAAPSTWAAETAF